MSLSTGRLPGHQVVQLLSAEELLGILPHGDRAMCLDGLFICKTGKGEQYPIGCVTFHPGYDFRADGHLDGLPVFPQHWLQEAFGLTVAAFLLKDIPRADRPYSVALYGSIRNMGVPILEGDELDLLVVCCTASKGREVTYIGAASNQYGDVVAEVEAAGSAISRTALARMVRMEMRRRNERVRIDASP